MYEAIERSDEIELLIEDVSPEAVLSEGLLALSEVLAADVSGGRPVTHQIELVGEGLRELFAGWMAELVRLAEAEGFAPERLVKLRLEAGGLSATVAGERSLPRSRIRSVRYDHVEVKRLEDAAWAARVVLEL